MKAETSASETRNTQGRRERSPELAKELVAAKVDVIVAVAPIAIRTAAQAAREVPIVMAWWGGSDLVESGVIASYARPGGNVTGVDMLLSALDAKRLDVLRAGRAEGDEDRRVRPQRADL